jgi:hypothetical protein
MAKKRPGLWENIRAKRRRIAAGSKERMRSVGAKGAPTAEAIKAASKGSNKASSRKTRKTKKR